MTTGAVADSTTPTACAGPHDAPLSIHSTQNSVIVPSSWPSRLPARAVCAAIAAAATAAMIASLRMIAKCADAGAPLTAVASATATPPATPVTAVATGVHRRRPCLGIEPCAAMSPAFIHPPGDQPWRVYAPVFVGGPRPCIPVW